MKVFLGSDHAGVEVKELIKNILENLECTFEDLGVYDKNSNDDYPITARLVARGVLTQENSFGILICGSGTGMVIAANKVRGIRAAMCYDEYSSMMARYDNNANVLCLRAREFDSNKYEVIVKTFLLTQFSNFERHQRRISLLEK